MDKCKCSRKCGCSIFLKVLLIIGGLNWGLVGIGGFLAKDINLVSMIFGNMPQIEWIVYIIVGISALISIFGCKCKKCSSCGVCDSASKKTM